MQKRYNLALLVLVSGIVLGLTPLMVFVEAQAQIVFASNRDGRTWEIYVMDADGRNPRRLTNNHHNDWDPSWSPDGKRIIFSSRQELLDRNRHGNAPHDIYVMDADGENLQRLTENPKYDISPSWSPDGQRIAFVSNRDRNWEIYVMDAEGRNPQNLTENRFDDRDPSWSPDGKRIAFVSNRDKNWEIYVMDADGGNPQNLTENRFDDRYPSWSPDGKRIVFSTGREGYFEDVFGFTDEIYVIDVDGGNEQRLTENRFDDRDPSWSPDGQHIAFVSYRIKFFWSDIYVMDADGGNERNLTKHNSWNTDPSWYIPTLAVSSVGKTLTVWARVKQVDR